MKKNRTLFNTNMNQTEYLFDTSWSTLPWFSILSESPATIFSGLISTIETHILYVRNIISQGTRNFRALGSDYE